MLIDFEGPIFILAVLILIGLVIFLKVKRKKAYLYLIFFSVFYIYICKVLDYTQFPIIFDDYMRSEIGQNVWRDANWLPFNPNTFAIKTSLLNVLLTVPFGFGIPFIVKVNLKKIVLSGFLFSLLLEGMQLLTALAIGFTFRYIDVNDLIFNTMGAVLGYGLFKLFMTVFKKLINKFEVSMNPFLTYIYETE